MPTPARKESLLSEGNLVFVQSVHGNYVGRVAGRTDLPGVQLADAAQVTCGHEQMLKDGKKLGTVTRLGTVEVPLSVVKDVVAWPHGLEVLPGFVPPAG